ncbi:MAG: iron-sulfur cluster repair di-iron protein [Cryomorphaceae bacterium]|nr:MAG: iron-sulfur cluster repair di-iron protein [Cryomorphaceae bacterium]
MNITEKHIIGELVARDYRAASVFKAHNIDFCCNGNRTIADACAKHGLNSEQIIGELENAMTQANSGNIDFQSWPPDLLVDYIEKKHHRYVEAKIPEIKAYLNRIAKVHGDNHPELHVVEQHFAESSGALVAHMKKEELILFPFIKKLAAADENDEQLPAPHFGTVENPIAMMHEEHDAEGERFREIARLTNNYEPPEDACNTYRVAFALLQEFENDLHMHIHLENNILFPMTIELEKE